MQIPIQKARRKNKYMHMKERRDLERKWVSQWILLFYLWNLKYWLPEPQGLQIPSSTNSNKPFRVHKTCKTLNHRSMWFSKIQVLEVRIFPSTVLCFLRETLWTILASHGNPTYSTLGEKTTKLINSELHRLK